MTGNYSSDANYLREVFRVLGDYSKAKNLAEKFSKDKKILTSGGTFDPMRVEAKKTIPFEWLRQMKDFPTAYIQALSGGTGPIGVIKGCKFK